MANSKTKRSATSFLRKPNINNNDNKMNTKQNEIHHLFYFNVKNSLNVYTFYKNHKS